MFDDLDFIFYLRYLQYWQQPQYLALLVSAKPQPMCLNILTMLIEGIDFDVLEEKLYAK